MKRECLKIVTILTVMALGLGALSGCTNKAGKNSENSAGQIPTLKVFFQENVSPDKDLVAEAVSKIVKDKIGANVSFSMYSAGEYSEKIPLILASNEKMDIGFDQGIQFIERAKKNAYYDITEPLKSSEKKLYDTIPKVLWDGVTVNKSIFGVPTYKEIAEEWILYVETDFIKNKNIDISKINTIADAEIILKALKEDPKRCGYIISPKTAHMNLALKEDYDDVFGNFVVSKKEKTTIKHFAQTEEFKNYVNLMNSWYKKGYIAQDVITRENYNEYIADGNQNYGLGIVSYSPYHEVAKAKTYGKEFTVIRITPKTISNTSATGSIFGVYNKSQNPDLALKFLELWNTDAKIKNLIAFGIEGKHYNLVDGKVNFVPNYQKMYSMQNWASGNVMISSLLVGEPDDKYKKYEEFNNAATVAVTYGFQPDISAIKDLIAACDSACAEYIPMLSCGVLEPTENMAKLNNALKSAGVDKVISELQRQYDEWLKTK